MDETITQPLDSEPIDDMGVERKGDFTITKTGERATIGLMAEVHGDSPGELNQITNELLTDPMVAQLVFDLSRTQYVDSRAMRSLVLAAQRARGLREKGADKKVILLDLQPPIQEMLEKAGLLKQSDNGNIFDLEESPKE